ncbi:DoxX family protein [Paenibacillus sp. UNC496MF]|uniref:DoxX family protein n=1 Tax=Paenibacillus sp. UNC496MF TaxID=1502753 RepID=UPI003529CA8E
MMNIEREKQVNLGTAITGGWLWTARIMNGIVILFMLFDGIGKIAGLTSAVEGTIALGFTERHMAAMGILGLVSALLCAIPRTSFMGGLVLTAYLGGAVAAQIRVDAPLFTNILFPVYVAILFWWAFWLRDERLRRLLS